MGELAAGTVLQGKYQVDVVVGEGGSSRLYRGHPLEGAGQVAIKELAVDEGSPDDVEDLARFEREYDLLKGLEHRGITHVLDLFEEDGRHYLVEEFVPGQTLESIIEERGKLGPEEAVGIVGAVLDILGYLHDRQIIYRDLKPSNVMVQPDGQVRLVDFGTARRWKRGVVRDTTPLGTPGYAAPEQYGGAQSDARTDVFSAGVLLHHLLTGAPPPVEGWKISSPSDIVPDVPRALGLVVLKATEKDPARRYRLAADMRADMVKATRPDCCPACGRLVPPLATCPCADVLPPPPPRPSISDALPAILIAVVIFVGLAIVITPNFMRSRTRGVLTACKSNLKNIGTALEMYSTDNGGLFPRSISLLTPNYLKVIPTCPSTGKATYADGYEGSDQAYTVVCKGRNHGNLNQGPDYPQYTSSQGLIAQ